MPNRNTPIPNLNIPEPEFTANKYSIEPCKIRQISKSILPKEAREMLKGIGLPYEATDKQIVDRMVEIKRLEYRMKARKKSSEKLLGSIGICLLWGTAFPKDTNGNIIKAK